MCACEDVAFLVEDGDELFPTAYATVRDHRLRTIGIVEPEDRSLAPGARRAEARRVERIALDLDGAPRVVLHEHAGRIAIEQCRCREIPRHAGDDAGRLGGARHQPARRRLRPAGGEPGHGHRCSHEPKKSSTVDCLADRSGEAGELVLEPGLELGGLRNFLKAPPIDDAARSCEPSAQGRDVKPGINAHLWHVEQSVRPAVVTWLLARSCAGVGVSGDRFQFGSNTASSGRKRGPGSR